MPELLSESDAFDADVQVPEDLEDADAASLRDTFVQKLVNRTLYLFNRLSQMPVFKDGSALTVRKALDFLGNNITVVDHPGTARTRISVPGPYVAQGLVLEWQGPDELRVAPGVALDNDLATAIHLPAAVALDLQASGPGGLDEGVLPTLGEGEYAWFQVHLLYDSTGANPVSGILSYGGAFGPEMPAGYDTFRYLGSWVWTDFGFRQAAMFEMGDVREVWYADTGDANEYSDDIERDDLRVLDGGAAADWTDIDLRGHVPPIDTIAVMLDLVNFNGSSAGFMLRVKDSQSVNPPVRIEFAGSGNYAHKSEMLVSMSAFTRLQYKRDGGEDGALSVWVRGYRERLQTGLGDS